MTLPALFDALARPDAEDAVARALDEDLGARFGGAGDVTSLASIPAAMQGRATIVSRADGVLAGVRVAEIVARRAGLRIDVRVDDGARLVRGLERMKCAKVALGFGGAFDAKDAREFGQSMGEGVAIANWRVDMFDGKATTRAARAPSLPRRSRRSLL